MKKNKIAAWVFAGIIAAASNISAQSFAVDFDGKGIRDRSFMEVVKNAGACQNDKMGCEEPKAEAIAEGESQFVQVANTKKPASKQPLIKSILADYNSQILHDDNIAEDLQTEGVIVAFRLPGEILITRNGETLSVIKDAALLEAIRLALLSRDGENRVGEGCIAWAVRQVWVYVQGVLVEKAVKVCIEFAGDVVENLPPSQPPTPNPYPQAPGYSAGCYTHPNNQVLCE